MHVLVVGESLVDIVRAADGTETEYAGGSAANVAVALARLGRLVRFATSFADDRRGRMVAQHLAQSGVALATDPGAVSRTSTAVATIGSDGSARYEFDIDWRLNPVAAREEPRLVHVCSLGAVLSPGADDVHALAARLRERATVCYDINARPAVTGTGAVTVAGVERMVGVSDLVKASDEDLAVLYPDRTLESAVQGLLTLGAVAVVVTRGVAGATWFSPDRHVDVSSHPTPVADTIGAGDTFAAGLIDALWQRDLLGATRRQDLAAAAADVITEVLAHAARAAAVTVSRPGADPPYRAELG